MKKLLSAAVATAMVASLTVPAFAATDLTTSPAENQGAGDYGIGVNGKFENGTTATDVISVDIEWESMSFTYKAGSTNYDPSQHKNTTTSGTWSDDKAAITVTNHSNVGVEATMSFAATAEGVTGSFYTKDGENYTKVTDTAINLGSGENTENATDFTPPKGSLSFGIDSTSAAIDADTKLGTITVKIEKAATVVTTEEALKEALEAIQTTGGTIKLGENITLTSGGDQYNPTALAITGGTEANPIVLDLNNHTLTGTLSVGADSNCYLKVKNGVLAYSTGTEYDVENGGIVNAGSGANIELESVTINAGHILAVNGRGGKVHIANSTMNTGIELESGDGLLVNNQNATVTLSGTVTIGGIMYIGTNGTVVLKAGGTYTLNNANVAVESDMTYPNAEASGNWYQESNWSV